MHLTTVQYVFRKRRFRKLLGILLLFALFLGLLIVPVERAAGGNIRTPLDAVYWTVTTMTSVGYGDYVPVSVMGKIIAMGLQLNGALTFGMIVVLLTLSLNRIEADFAWRRTQDRINDLEKKIDRIERNIVFLIRSIEEKESSNQKKKS